MFNAISAKPNESSETTPVMPTPRHWAPEPPQPLKQETPAPPGSFTQFFQGTQQARDPGPLQPAPPAVPPQSASPSAPGSFTEIFSQRGAEKTPFEDPLKSLRPEPIPERSYQFSNSPAPSPESHASRARRLHPVAPRAEQGRTRCREGSGIIYASNSGTGCGFTAGWRIYAASADTLG